MRRQVFRFFGVAVIFAVLVIVTGAVIVSGPMKYTSGPRPCCTP